MPIKRHTTTKLVDTALADVGVAGNPQAVTFTGSVASVLPAGYKSFHKFGRNITVNGTALETIWSGPESAGPILYPWPSVSDTYTIESSNAADTSLAVEVQYMSAGVLVVENVVTDAVNGTTPVATTFSGEAVLRMRNKGATDNVGNLILKHSASGDMLAHIAIGKNQTQQCIFEIESGYIGYMHLMGGSASTGSVEMDMTIWAKKAGEGVFQLKGTFPVRGNAFSARDVPLNIGGALDSGIKFTAGTKIEMRAARGSGTGNINVTGHFTMMSIPT